jgi:hypothetical protein
MYIKCSLLVLSNIAFLFNIVYNIELFETCYLELHVVKMIHWSRNLQFPARAHFYEKTWCRTLLIFLSFVANADRYLGCCCMLDKQTIVINCWTQVDVRAYPYFEMLHLRFYRSLEHSWLEVTTEVCTTLSTYPIQHNFHVICRLIFFSLGVSPLSPYSVSLLTSSLTYYNKEEWNYITADNYVSLHLVVIFRKYKIQIPFFTTSLVLLTKLLPALSNQTRLELSLFHFCDSYDYWINNNNYYLLLVGGGNK